MFSLPFTFACGSTAPIAKLASRIKGDAFLIRQGGANSGAKSKLRVSTSKSFWHFRLYKMPAICKISL